MNSGLQKEMLIKCSEITTMKNDGYKYRVCKKCSNKWNISVLTKSTKCYICPCCNKKLKRSEKNE